MVPYPKTYPEKIWEAEKPGGTSGTEREEREQMSFNPAKDSYITSSQEKAVFSNQATCPHFSKGLKTPEEVAHAHSLMSLGYVLLESLQILWIKSC